MILYLFLDDLWIKESWILNLESDLPCLSYLDSDWDRSDRRNLHESQAPVSLCIASDDFATQRATPDGIARASGAVVVTEFSRNIPVSAPEGF